MTFIQSNGWTEIDLILKNYGGYLYDNRSAFSVNGLALKLTCDHINRRPICLNIKSISVHPLLWINVMLDFICMIFVELLSTGYKRKIQYNIVCIRWESDQRPLAF